jgi:hypothetical protein
MALEHAFLHQRLALVENWLANPDRSNLVPAGKGPVHRRTRPVSPQELVYKREARLLRRLFARTREGMALKMLTTWRSDLSEFLWKHRQWYKEMQDDYDAWWRLPWDERQSVPKPPRPSAARHVDVDGTPWITDDRFLLNRTDTRRRK